MERHPQYMDREAKLKTIFYKLFFQVSHISNFKKLCTLQLCLQPQSISNFRQPYHEGKMWQNQGFLTQFFQFFEYWKLDISFACKTQVVGKEILTIIPVVIYQLQIKNWRNLTHHCLMILYSLFWMRILGSVPIKVRYVSKRGQKVIPGQPILQLYDDRVSPSDDQPSSSKRIKRENIHLKKSNKKGKTKNS